MAFFGDKLYYYATGWNEYTQTNSITYGIIDIRTKKKISDNFITDGTEKDIAVPYGIAIHPETGDIFVTDAKNYVSSGTLHCYDNTGRRKWSVRTGDIPAHITFLPR
jgi:DNA-binding beta-propeller fold protein YncE